MLRSIRQIFLLLLIALPASQTYATTTEQENTELDTRIVTDVVRYKVNRDGTYIEERETATRILTERAVKWHKQRSITYSTSIQKGEVLHAYTLKADGRKLEVPSRNFQYEINRGHNKESPVYSDQTTLTVVFPDVALGDTIVWSYRLTASEPLFPGHFSQVRAYNRYTAFDDVRISIDAPRDLNIRHKAYQIKEVENIEKDDRRRITWQWSNPKPIKDKEAYLGIYEPEKHPVVFISTFKSYADIADAYVKRADPIAAVTPRTQSLANEITKDAKGKRDEAKLLYEWIAKNISYAGNCIGLGAVVPRDQEFVLKNKMGDCKDRATLYQSLLSAKGIPSIQVLVNAGSVYTLPEVPTVQMVNHVINYLPGMDLYVDPTSSSTPFGMLPFSDADKPVLWTKNYRADTRTPPLPVGANRQVMRTKVIIDSEGNAKVKTSVSLKGNFAVKTRNRFRNLPKSQDDEIIGKMLRAMSLEGKGKFERADATALSDQFEYAAEYEAKNMFVMNSASGFAINSYFYSDAPVSSYLGVLYMENTDKPMSCGSGKTTEEFEFHFPRNVKLLAVPSNVKLANDVVSYSASYTQKGNVLRVKREIDDRTPGHVCTAQQMAEYKIIAKKIMTDLKSQVIYK